MKALNAALSFVFLLLLPASLLSQQWISECVDVGSQYYYSGAVQRGGLYKTADGSIRTLVVFVQFKGDTYEPNSPYWKIDSLPSFYNTFIDTTVTQLSTGGNLSHYYRTMSFDRLKIYGERYHVITQHTEKYYRDTLQLGNDAYGKVNKEVLQTLDPEINYALYDNWVFGTYNHSLGQDNKIDLIIMYYRRLSGFSLQSGIATLGLNELVDLTLDGKAVQFRFPSSGLTNNGGTYGTSLSSVKHEYGHFLGYL